MVLKAYGTANDARCGIEGNILRVDDQVILKRVGNIGVEILANKRPTV
jgi:hypothetical protein